MAWNPIDPAAVLTEFTPAEADALNALQGAQGILTLIVNRVINEFRGAIAAIGVETGPDGTVPDQIASHVIARARWEWLVSFPQLEGLQSDQRREANAAALKCLDAIAARKYAIEPAAGFNVPLRAGYQNNDGLTPGRMGPTNFT